MVLAYTCLVTAGAAGIYLARGWRALLWVAVPCAWGVLVFCYFNYALNGPGAASSSGLLNRQLLQGSVLFLSLAFWALPVLREVLVCINPARWLTPPRPFADYLGLSTFMKHQVPILTITLPAWAFYYSVALWSGAGSTETWGKAALGVSLLFAGAYFALKRYPLDFSYHPLYPCYRFDWFPDIGDIGSLCMETPSYLPWPWKRQLSIL